MAIIRCKCRLPKLGAGQTLRDRAGAAALRLLLLFPLWSGAVADDREQLTATTRELGAVQNRIQRLEQSVDGLDASREKLNDQLAALEIQYGRVSDAMRELATQIQSASQETEALQQRRQQTAHRILGHNQALVGQVRSAYAIGHQDWLKLLLNQEDAGVSGRVVTYYRYLSRARARQLQALERDLEELRGLEVAIRDKVLGLDGQRSELDRERARLDQARAERARLLADLERERQGKSAQLAQLNEDAGRLQEILAELRDATSPDPAEGERGPVVAGKNRLGWPVAGELRQRFGAPRMSGQWDGVLIAAREGEPVRAVAPGHVAFADWLRGYGLLAIIDHGNGLMSLYAYNQSLQRDVGDAVAAGEVVARVGVSGGQSEPALYFGLRDRGRPIDPLRWCQRDD